MDPFNSNRATSQRYSHNSPQDLFARALAELEKNSSGQKAKKNKPLQTHKAGEIFNADQLKNSGQVSVGQSLDQDQPNQAKNLFREMIKSENENRKRGVARHQEANPISEHKVFDLRSKQNTERINLIRGELDKLMNNMPASHNEVELAVTQDVVAVGLTGSYHENFFEKLKQGIILLRQRAHSARTWAKQERLKQARKRRKYGLDFADNETKAVHDSFHHERSMSLGA